ncbi:MAG: pirin family protein [Betaproteobacteria bacterium]
MQPDHECAATQPHVIDALINPPTRDLGDGFQVRRALPAAERRTVGPFVFFDQMGPVTLPAGKGLDVRPHPHIGLATLTYLFDGEIDHRDSLGTVQRIVPGEVNWMTAGRGIVHSERTPQEQRARPRRTFGLQVWLALPKEDEEMEPGFAHHGADELPSIEEGRASLRLVAGTLRGGRSPVPVRSPTLFADLRLHGSFTLDPEHDQQAVYVVDGAVEIDGTPVEAGRLAIAGTGKGVEIGATKLARVVLFGGASLGPRRLWWNFVASDMARIRRAAQDWKAGRFPAVPGETEFIPLPERGPPEVDYP